MRSNKPTPSQPSVVAPRPHEGPIKARLKAERDKLMYDRQRINGMIAGIELAIGVVDMGIEEKLMWIL